MSATFATGGGRYELKDSLYTEHLEYCSDRLVEESDFTFTISKKNNVLIQSGIEKIEETGVDVFNVENMFA